MHVNTARSDRTRTSLSHPDSITFKKCVLHEIHNEFFDLRDNWIDACCSLSNDFPETLETPVVFLNTIHSLYGKTEQFEKNLMAKIFSRVSGTGED